jgi:hypothetical protein
MSGQYACHILIEIEVSQQIFENTSNIKFHKNLCSGSQVVPCRQADTHTHKCTRACTHTHTHDKANSCFSQFCENA